MSGNDNLLVVESEAKFRNILKNSERSLSQAIENKK